MLLREMKWWPKKKETGDFLDEPYCKSCRSSERFCKCEGYNQALDELGSKKVELNIGKLVHLIAGTEEELSCAYTEEDYILAETIAKKLPNLLKVV